MKTNRVIEHVDAAVVNGHDRREGQNLMAAAAHALEESVLDGLAADEPKVMATGWELAVVTGNIPLQAAETAAVR